MLRRCVSLLAIMGLFASQLAAVPHAHAGLSTDEQKEHDATPHFHCGWPGHHHGHGHSHHGHTHHDDCPAEPEAETTPALPDGLSGVAHDGTAVYGPGNVTVASAGPQRGLHLERLARSVSLVLCRPLVEMQRTGGGFEPVRPPDKVLDDSNIYLVLRNLRI